jgi:hypothetical protein
MVVRERSEVNSVHGVPVCDRVGRTSNKNRNTTESLLDRIIPAQNLSTFRHPIPVALDALLRWTNRFFIFLPGIFLPLVAVASSQPTEDRPAFAFDGLLYCCSMILSSNDSVNALLVVGFCSLFTGSRPRPRDWAHHECILSRSFVFRFVPFDALPYCVLGRTI